MADFAGEICQDRGRLGRPSRQRRAPKAPWGLPTPNVRSTLGQRSVNVGSTLGQRWVNVGSTLGQPWVNVGSTLGNLRTYLGPIFADFARVSGETEGLHGVLIRNDQFSNRETAFSGFVLDQSPLRAPWEKKKRIPNVSIDLVEKKPARSSVFSLKKRLWFWRDHFPRESATFPRESFRSQNLRWS